MTITAKQREMARHALGFPNQGKRSYRNRYFAPAESDALGAWQDLVAKGYAIVQRKRKEAHPYDVFSLTRAGAELVLEKDERLDLSDFPPIAAN